MTSTHNDSLTDYLQIRRGSQPYSTIV